MALAVELRRRGLIESNTLFHAEDADRLQQPQRAERVGVGGIFRRFEAYLDMALGGEIVDFRRLRFLDQPDEVGGIGHVAVVQKKFDAFDMRVLIQVVDALGVERGRAPLHAMHDIALAEQKLGQIGAILTGHAGDQGDLLNDMVSTSFLAWNCSPKSTRRLAT